MIPFPKEFIIDLISNLKINSLTPIATRGQKIRKLLPASNESDMASRL